MAYKNIIKKYDDTENDKKGIEIAGRDVVQLNAPEVLLSPDTPLLTKAQDVAGAINELFQLDPGGGDEDWQPPDWWISVPEPAPYEIYFLIEVTETTQPNPNMQIFLCDPETGNLDVGPLTVDWGDGTIMYAYDGGAQSWYEATRHTYTETGQFLIKITATKQSCQLYYMQCYYSNRTDFPAILIAKLGSEIRIHGERNYGNRIFTNQYKLHWIKLSGKGGLPTNSAFYNCYVLQRFDIDILPEVIPENCFLNCRSLKKFDFSKVKEIQSYSLQNTAFTKLDLPECISIGAYAAEYDYQLGEINAPLCKSVGSGGFAYCTALDRVVFADDCTFGASCFINCYSLYPRPDGSTI